MIPQRLKRAARLGRSHGTSLGATAARAAVDCLRALFADEGTFLIVGVTVSLATLSTLIALLVIVSSTLVAFLSWLAIQWGPVLSTVGLLGVLTLVGCYFHYRPVGSPTAILGTQTMECGRDPAGAHSPRRGSDSHAGHGDSED